MRVIRESNFEEVISVFDSEHSKTSGTHSWVKRKLLPRVNRLFDGKWDLVDLEAQETINKIILMSHPSGGHRDGDDDFYLVPDRGSTVEDATKRFLDVEDQYKVKNAKCYNLIINLKKTDFSPIFISANPPNGKKIPGHKKTLLSQDSYLHLDGQHRLVAWNLAGKFQQEYYNKNKLTAYFAGRSLSEK